MLTSHVPSPEREGQQLTRGWIEQTETGWTIRLTRKRNIVLFRTRIAPLQYTNTMVEWEWFRRIFKGNNFIRLGGSEFVRVGVILELQSVATKVCWRGSERKLDMGDRFIGDIEYHVALELHGFYTSIAEDAEGKLFLNNNVNAERES